MVHEFLVSGCDNREVMYYIEQTKIPAKNPQYEKIHEQASYIFDPKRQFYPLMVLLKAEKTGKN